MEEKLTATLAWRPQLVQQILSQDVLLALDEFSCILDLPTISHCFQNAWGLIKLKKIFAKLHSPSFFKPMWILRGI